MKVVLLSSSFNGLTQRVYRELSLAGHEILQHYDLEPDTLRRELESFQPDVVLCPFLTQRIPDDVWRNYLCLIVHPGIEGDRGPSSLDWAISENSSYWGVTLLQADAEMDAGDIWGTREFKLRASPKTSVYKREVVAAASALISKAMTDLKRGRFKPRPLNYDNPKVKGRLRPLCRQADRLIDWQQDSTETVISKLNAADTNPGVKDDWFGYDMRLFGGVADYERRGEPGKLIATYKSAVCVATVDGSVWLRQLKCKDHPNVAPIKLPANQVVRHICPDQAWDGVEHVTARAPTEEIRVEHQGDIAYVYFDFYNGAANTQQCKELRNEIVAVKQSDAKVIVFMGGEDFFCNGIHLNCIEAADDPALESWHNINAIDDLVHEIINCPNQLTVAALRNNAGAGGAIMALACDEVIVREGVVLNPHYINMGLYGSEYWTYLLPKKIGRERAESIINSGEPLLAGYWLCRPAVTGGLGGLSQRSHAPVPQALQTPCV